MTGSPLKKSKVGKDFPSVRKSKAGPPLRSLYLELVCIFTVILLPAVVYFVYPSSSPHPDIAPPLEVLRPEKSEDPLLPFCKPPYSVDPLTEHSVFDCAARFARVYEQRSLQSSTGTQRIAFLFLSRGPIHHEPLWKRFFQGHENLYSIYVHAEPSFHFPNASFFYNHQIPSEKVARLSITLVDAMRRLMAYAVLDHVHGPTNSWFVLVCEVTIPIRSFKYTYDYLMRSQHSFVESFAPKKYYHSWDSLPEFERWRLRKGEVWMAVHRRHTAMILSDWTLYYKFRSHAKNQDEQYIQTLLGLKDPQGIANRTVMYVDWSGHHAASPKTFDAEHVSPKWIQDIQGRRIDSDGQYHDTSLDKEERKVKTVNRTCSYNGVANSPCFLFVRKVANAATPLVANMSHRVLGY